MGQTPGFKEVGWLQTIPISECSLELQNIRASRHLKPDLLVPSSFVEKEFEAEKSPVTHPWSHRQAMP